VTRVTDLEGAVTRIICPQFEYATGVCHLKREALDAGPLTRLLARTAENILDTRDTRCILW